MKSIDELKDYVQSHSDEMFYETIDGCGRRVRVVTCSEGYIINLIEQVEREVKESDSTASEAVLFSQRVEEAVRNGDDLTLFGVDYMPYPVDKQDRVIRPGDSVYVMGRLNPRKVEGVGRKFGKTPAVWFSNGTWEFASCIESHDIPPSPVEELLTEMYDRLDEPKGEDAHKSASEIIGEYAARLKLREADDDEG